MLFNSLLFLQIMLSISETLREWITWVWGRILTVSEGKLTLITRITVNNIHEMQQNTNRTRGRLQVPELVCRTACSWLVRIGSRKSGWIEFTSRVQRHWSGRILHFTLYIRKCISTLMFLFWYQRFVIKWQPTESNLSTNGFHKRTYQRKLCLAQLANINRNSCRLNSSFYTYWKQLNSHELLRFYFPSVFIYVWIVAS